MSGERPLRVALLEPAGRGGIFHYAWGLAAALQRLADARSPAGALRAAQRAPTTDGAI
jgi:hypothetical protein